MRILALFIGACCLAVIVYGNVHWNKKIEDVSTDGVLSTSPEEVVKDEKIVSNEEGKISTDITRITSGLPAEVAGFIQKSAKENETLELVIMGSEANTMGDNPWTDIFSKEMEKAYEGLFHVSVYAIPEVTTIDMVNEGLHMEILEKAPDIIILEPFILNDNGLVAIEQSLENVQSIIEDIRGDNPDTFFFIQAPHPLYNAVNYPLAVEQLKQLSDSEGHAFIDHWTSWPNYQSEEIKPYLLDGSDAPTELGHKVWAEHILNIFINSEKE